MTSYRMIVGRDVPLCGFTAAKSMTDGATISHCDRCPADQAKSFTIDGKGRLAWRVRPAPVCLTRGPGPAQCSLSTGPFSRIERR
jgi:hypothetical protein